METLRLSKLYSLLGFDAGFARMFDLLHLGDEVGQLDERVGGAAVGDGDVHFSAVERTAQEFTIFPHRCRCQLRYPRQN